MYFILEYVNNSVEFNVFIFIAFCTYLRATTSMIFKFTVIFNRLRSFTLTTIQFIDECAFGSIHNHGFMINLKEFPSLLLFAVFLAFWRHLNLDFVFPHLDCHKWIWTPRSSLRFPPFFLVSILVSELYVAFSQTNHQSTNKPST